MHQYLNLEYQPLPVVSISPVTVAPAAWSDRGYDLQVRVSAPVSGSALPVIFFSHGFGSSMDAYAPLVNYWAAHGFVVIQPTYLDSRTLSEHPEADHGAAVQAFLTDPRKLTIWRSRVLDLKMVIDNLDLILEALPGLKGRVDRERLSAAGHSFGAQTAALLLGARVQGANGIAGEDFYDKRIKAGILLSAAGSGGDALSPFAKEHFPYLNQSYAGLVTPTLVVAGDQDRSPLTVTGPEWFTEPYHLSPGADALLTLHGGQHMLGGISGYLVRETTDENTERVSAVKQLGLAYLQSFQGSNNTVWSGALEAFAAHGKATGQVKVKST